jgi:hypothetical protein
VTRDQAIQAAAQPITDGYTTLLGLDGTSVEQAARAAWTPTGPELPELIDRITAVRAHQLAAA